MAAERSVQAGASFLDDFSRNVAIPAANASNAAGGDDPVLHEHRERLAIGRGERPALIARDVQRDVHGLLNDHEDAHRDGVLEEQIALQARECLRPPLPEPLEVIL